MLILPALFDEANKLRHFTVEVMRRLDAAGIDSFLPDLPGCNESRAPLETQTLTGWREAAEAAAGLFLGTCGQLDDPLGAFLGRLQNYARWRYAPATRRFDPARHVGGRR